MNNVTKMETIRIDRTQFTIATVGFFYSSLVQKKYPHPTRESAAFRTWIESIFSEVMATFPNIEFTGELNLPVIWEDAFEGRGMADAHTIVVAELHANPCQSIDPGFKKLLFSLLLANAHNVMRLPNAEINKA